MTDEKPKMLVASPSRWPVRVAYFFALVCLAGALFSWNEVCRVSEQRKIVSRSISQAETTGADESTIRSMLASYRKLGLAEGQWARRRLGLFMATGILVFGGFLGTGLLNLHDKMVWQIRDESELSEHDYGGS